MDVLILHCGGVMNTRFFVDCEYMKTIRKLSVNIM